MLEESTNGANDTEIEYLKVAADLLQRMLLKLKDIAANNAPERFFGN